MNGYITPGSNTFTCSPEGQPYPGLNRQQRGQQGKGEDSAPLLCWDPTRSPVSSSGALSTGKTWTCWSGDRGGHKSDQRAGAPLLWGNAERDGVVQPGEENAPGRPYCSLSVLTGGLIRKMETKFLARPIATGVMGLNQKRIESD